LEIVTLKAQLSEFRQPALAVAGGTTWDSDTTEAAEPLSGSSSYSNASWANNWSSGVIRSADGGTAVAEAQPQALSVLQSQLSAATVRCEASANAFDMLPVVTDRSVFKIHDLSVCYSVLISWYFAFTGLKCVLAMISQFLQLLGL